MGDDQHPRSEVIALRRVFLAAILCVTACAGHEPERTPHAPRPTPTVAPSSATPATHPRFVVHVVDVGTGLAVLVRGADFALVYDGGSNDDLALGDKNRFVAYLAAVAPDLARLDHVILSHPHRDHVELLSDVVLRYKPRDVWDSGAVNDICGYRRFLGAVESTAASYHSGTTGPVDFKRSLCDEKLSPVVHLQRGTPLSEGVAVPLGEHATMTFLHVDPAVHEGNYNENSLVTLLDLDGERVLLMGDAEAGGREDPAKPPTKSSVEGYLLAHHAALLRADVLVVGHHGSRTSSRKRFLDAVAPKISVISAGPMKYGTVTLPDADIVSELRAVSRVYRTDDDDAACATNPHKIGPDADGFPGGCSNVVITLHAGSASAEYTHSFD
ncbi:hypothetical protein BH09MYX1_BH09MYX1_56340 [soil metagenome]